MFENMRRRKEISRETVFRVLSENNISKLHVNYSGGNDDGGIDYFEVFLKDGTQCKAFYGSYRDGYCDLDEGMIDINNYVSYFHHDKDFFDALEKPIYNYTGHDRSFAGNFETQGTLIWDVDQKKVSIDDYTKEYNSDDDDED